MGFFNNVGVTPPTKDNIYSLFCIPEIYHRYYGKVRIAKTSTGICISIDNEIYSNEPEKAYVSESKDFDTKEIVKCLYEKQLCIEDIQEIRLYFATKSRTYMPGSMRLIFCPDSATVDVILKNNRSLRIDIDPI